MSHSMLHKQDQLTQHLPLGLFLGTTTLVTTHYMCVWSLLCLLSQFRMVLEICPIEFSLFWEFHNIDQPLATPIEMSYYVNNYLPWIPVGVRIGKSIVFEVRNQKKKVKTLKKIRFWWKYGSSQRKNQQKLFKLVHGCQAITEKVKTLTKVTKGILLRT